MAAVAVSIVCSLVLMLAAAPAQGATITVTTTADEFGAGMPTDTGCSLREAVFAIDTAGNFDVCTGMSYGTNDTIMLPAGTYALDRDGGGEDGDSTGDLDLGMSMTITGTGNPTIDQTFTGGAEDRLIDAFASLTLNGVTLRDGMATSAAQNTGGNIRFNGDGDDVLRLSNTDVIGGIAGDSAGGSGAGIRASGDVVIENGSLLQDNVSPGVASSAGIGGGISVVGTGSSLTVTDSEISSNDAGRDGGAGTIGIGGGIHFSTGAMPATIAITNSTIDDNRAGGGTSRGSGLGGGISIDGASMTTLNITGGSVSGNEAGGGPGWTVGGESAGFGGGIDFEPSTGSTTIQGVDVDGNRAGGNGDRGNGIGGGINTNQDLIVIDSTISQNLAGVDAALSGPPDLNADGGGINVIGSGSDLTIDDSQITGNQGGENATVGGGIKMAGTGNLVITDSAIAMNAAGTAGNMGTSRGGGVSRTAGGAASADTIARTSITGNSVVGIGTVPATRGGGLDAETAGTFSIDQSTFSANTATNEINTGSAGGAALDSVSGNDGIYTVTNSTFNGNVATGLAGGVGGGVATGPVQGSGTPPQVTFTHSTLAGNTANLTGVAGGFGGNLWVRDEIAGSRVELRATIVSGGVGEAGDENCFGNAVGVMETFGENVESTTPTQCDLTAVEGDQIGVNPMLAALAPNGGLTQTMALMTGSPAIDSVNAGCPPPTTDQRGTTRPQGGLCDAGAFEFVAPLPVGGGGGSTTPAPVKKKCKKGRKLKKGKCVKKKRKKKR